MLFAGCASWSLSGRSSKPSTWDGVEEHNVLNFSRIRSLCNIKITNIASGCQANHSLAFASDGRGFIWGRNEHGQLGLGDHTNRYRPSLLNNKSLVGGACGPSHTIIFGVDGACFSSGLNDCGQLGIRRVSSTTEFKRIEVPEVTAVSCGSNFSALVTTDCHVYMMGCPEHGQLGNGNEGKCLEKAGKVTFNNVFQPLRLNSLAGLQITSVACGAKHVCAMDSEGMLWTWGFGGYGALGHTDNKNQLLPKKLDFFSFVAPPKPDNVPKFLWRPKPSYRATQISSGATCTYAVSKRKCLYMWGVTKKSGECNMYPKPIRDLQGWRVARVSTGKTSTIVAADQSLITWGPSPTWGELGYGKDGPKSSTKAQKVESLEEGGEFLKVVMGGSHSLIILKPTDPKFIKTLPVLDQPELDCGGGGKRKAGAAAGQTAKKKKTTKKKTGAKTKAGAKKKKVGTKKKAGAKKKKAGTKKKTGGKKAAGKKKTVGKKKTGAPQKKE